MIARLRGQEDGENCNACPSLISDPSAADLVCLCTLPPSEMLCNIWTFDFIRLLHVCMRMPCPGGELGCGPLLDMIDHLQVDHSRTDHPSHSSAPLNVHTVEEGSTFPNGIGSCHSLSKATMVSPCPHSSLRLHPHGSRSLEYLLFACPLRPRIVLALRQTISDNYRLTGRRLIADLSIRDSTALPVQTDVKAYIGIYILWEASFEDLCHSIYILYLCVCTCVHTYSWINSRSLARP